MGLGKDSQEELVDYICMEYVFDQMLLHEIEMLAIERNHHLVLQVCQTFLLVH